MPDRFGDDRPGRDTDETPDPAAPLPTAARLDNHQRAAARRAAINNCTLCDPDGYRPPNPAPCDHTDHTQTAQRGMALIRAQMGWTPPAGTPTTKHTQKPAQRRIRPPNDTAVTHPHPNQHDTDNHPAEPPPAPPTQKIHTMPPVMTRKASQQRCRDGWDLRRRGRTWQEVADEVTPPFRSRQAAQKAVQTWLAANPPDELETMRRASGDTLLDTIAVCGETMREAKTAGKFRDVAELGKAVIDGVERYAKLTGQHVVVPKEVSVHVQSVTEIISSTRSQLLAALDARSGIVDAEVVVPKALGS